MGFLDRLRSGPGGDVPAVGTVMWLAPTEKGRPGAPHVMRLRVMPAHGEAYELEHETVVPTDRLPANGDTLQLRVSPHDPTRIEVDWSAQATRAGRTATGAAEALGFGPVDDERQSDR